MMPILLFKGFPHSGHYNGPSGKFITGQQQEVSADAAAYLLETFGDAFEVVGSAPAKAKTDRAVKSPKRKKAAPKKDAKK